MSGSELGGNEAKTPSPESGALSTRVGGGTLSGGNRSPLLSIGVTRAILSLKSVRITFPAKSWMVTVTYRGTSGDIPYGDSASASVP